MPLTTNDLDEIFSYHRPEQYQIEHFEHIRLAAREFAEQILLHTPPSPDQDVAIRKIREAVMTANSAIALNGEY